MASEPAKVFLIGAGPGEPELITLLGRRRLAEADVVLYDALVHPEVLEWAARHAELVPVGKRAGRPSQRQAEINARMLQASRDGLTVARLKGGDPYLFGRGSEEAAFLSANQIPFEVVPGVSSPIAAAAFSGITLTEREASSSVAFITATESADKDRSSHDWAKLATGPSTLVIFMGLRKLESLISLLVENGRDPGTPAAAVQWASLPAQRTVVATLGELASEVRRHELGLPSLVIVGEVVAQREQRRWFDRKPLFGKRVLVTRPIHQNDEIRRLIRDAGAEPIALPAIRIRSPDDGEALARALRSIASYRWVVFTSANGVSAFFARAREEGLDARALGGVRVCAIGTATGAALERQGVFPDLIPSEFRGEAVAEALLARDPDLVGRRVLLPRAAVARAALPDLLRAAGVEVDIVHAYRTIGPSETDAERMRELLHHRRVDILTFTSPSTVERLAEALGEHADVAADFIIACIGPITAEAVRNRGWPVHVTAARYTAEGLVESLIEHYTRQSTS